MCAAKPLSKLSGLRCDLLLPCCSPLSLKQRQDNKPVQGTPSAPFSVLTCFCKAHANKQYKPIHLQEKLDHQSVGQAEVTLPYCTGCFIAVWVWLFFLTCPFFVLLICVSAYVFVRLCVCVGEACWWTIHPASKQRSEGEKVRVGDDLILVSISSERYLVSSSCACAGYWQKRKLDP